MLPDAKIPQLIAQQIPALKPGMEQGGAITKTIATFSAYTKQLIRGNRTGEVKQCFSIAGVLYHNGSALLKNAIESVFLFSISPLLDAKRLKELLPAPLQQLRYRHVQSIQ